MRRIRILQNERAVLYGSIGLRLVDDFTGGRPLRPVRARLEALGDNNKWRDTGLRPTYTPDGVLTFSNIARTANVDHQPRRFRIKLEENQIYDAHYRRRVNGHDLAGLEFDAYPFNADAPPANYAFSPAGDDDYRLLTPSAAYPFPGTISVIRGTVIDAASKRTLARAQISYSNKEGVQTRAKGFALPIRWLPRTTRTTQVATAGSTTLIFENVVRYGTVTKVAVIINKEVVQVCRISKIPNTVRTFGISPAVPGGTEWASGTIVRPLGISIDVNYEARHKSYEVALPDGFTKSHEIFI